MLLYCHSNESFLRYLGWHVWSCTVPIFFSPNRKHSVLKHLQMCIANFETLLERIGIKIKTRNRWEHIDVKTIAFDTVLFLAIL